MNWPPVLTLAESSAGWFSTSTGPLAMGLLFAYLHRGRRWEGRKHGKREFPRLDFQLSHHSKILSLFGLRQDQEGRPFLLCSTRSPCPVDIRIRIGRQFIVNHLGHILNIETSGCHIGGYERTESSGPKGTERPFPLRLAMVASQRPDRSRFSTQMGRQASHLILLITKHHRPFSTLHSLE